MKLQHLIDFNDITTDEYDELCRLASDIINAPHRYSAACSGRVMATLFYEPSTRTQLSFQTAMLRLGGTVIGFADPNSSSVAKGESLRDTVKIISGYADIGVIRNPMEGAAFAASLYSGIPFINAGDGRHLHPTQTMTDMFTIKREKGRYEGLNIGLCGDLKNGRTVHSLLRAFTRYNGNRFFLISTKELRVPDYILNEFSGSDNEIIMTDNMEEVIDGLDILYMTRIQRERFGSEADYRRQSGIYVLTPDKLKSAKPDLTIMHPLPKVDEIAYEVDDDPRSRYFEQAENGMYIRMALILSLIEGNPQRRSSRRAYPLPTRRFCSNPICVSNHEHYLPEMTKTVGGELVCAYCDYKII
ncbi:MAG: aspartate carbamoyltransferase [Clostridiales bacterium]|nr:aspartate carbamoyltransferase [Clostridiales bacterium]